MRAWWGWFTAILTWDDDLRLTDTSSEHLSTIVKRTVRQALVTEELANKKNART